MRTLQSVRTDIKFLANSGLQVFRGLQPLFIATNPLRVTQKNLSSIRQCEAHLAGGGAWERTKLLMLPREFLRLRGQRIRFEIGRAIPAEVWRPMDAETLTRYARVMAYLLETQPEFARRRHRVFRRSEVPLAR